MCTVIAPPTRSVTLPEHAASLIADAMARGLTGSITLHLHTGIPGDCELKVVVKPKRLTGKRVGA